MFRQEGEHAIQPRLVVDRRPSLSCGPRRSWRPSADEHMTGRRRRVVLGGEDDLKEVFLMLLAIRELVRQVAEMASPGTATNWRHADTIGMRHTRVRVRLLCPVEA